MDTGLPGREEYENRGSWIPATPFRPILPKPQPIYADGQANQLDKAKWLESGCFSSECSQGTQANNGFACFNPGIYTNMNGCVNNWEGSSAGINCNNVEAGREFAVDPMAQWKNIPCSNLLALANAAGIVNANIAAQRDVGTPSGSCISTAFSQTDGDPHHLLENANFSFRSNHWTNGNYAPTESQYELSIPHQHSYDLNFPPGKMPNAASNNTISEFVPITPDKNIRVKSKQVSELQNSCTNNRTHQERDGQNNEIAAERVDSNGIQCNKDLLDPVTDVSLAAESTHHMENHNPDKEAIDGIDLNKTPQQKQRRKKHRPKVITEGKPRTRKPVTPKPAVSKESPTGKRKYVRKKGLNNVSTTSPAKAAGESTNPETLESTKESCEKTSNFDIKRQSRDENSTGKPTFDSVSESQAKDSYISKSTMQLSERIEVMTPKPAGSKANPRGKRKYVRKKVLNKDSTSSPTEPAGESNDPKTPEPSKKSCKRTLNFDLEDQPRDENPTCESTIDLHSELQAKDSYRRIQSKATMQGDEGIEVIIENTQAGITYEFTRSVNGMLDCISLAEGQAPTTPLPTKKIPRQQKSNSGRKNNAESEDQETTNDGQDHTKHVMLQIGTRASPNECGIYTNLIEQGQAQGSKRKYCNAIEHANTGSFNQNGIHYHNLQSYQMQFAHFPIIFKKKRTEKGQNSTSSSTSSSITAAKDITLETTCSQSETKTDSSASKADDWISAPQSNDKVVSATLGEARTGLQDKRQILEAILAMSPTGKLRRKRSRCPTRVRDLASLTRIAECTMQPTYPEIQGPMDRDKQQTGNLQRPHTCIEILVAKLRETLTQKKRTNKRNSLVKSASSRINKMQKHNVILYSGHQFSASTLGALPELAWKQMFSIDAITEQLKHLDINRESSNIEYPEQYALVPYNMRNHEQNALVLYGRDGTVVPFDGSINLVKKRRPRPKVELDEETNRVWKLLLENINSEGIDGTNEENTKWWEEERKVFSGRVDSFIARMHLVQGDRRFSPWKGSVVDSVVGVFLTQNVSDHLSSSAFMSLAAHFPHKMKNTKPCHVEGSSSVIEEPVDCVLNPEDTIEWNEKMPHQPACDQGSITHHEFKHNEEKEVVSSNDSTGSSTCINLTNTSKCKLLNSCESGPETHADLIVNRSTTEIRGSGTVCSKGNRTETNVGISSQNSICFSIQNAERTRSSSDSNSDLGSLTNGSKLNSSTSFMELLQMTGSGMIHQVYNQGNGNMSSDENSQNEKNRFRTMERDNQRQEVENLDDPKKKLGVSSIQHHNFCSYVAQKSAVVVECCGITREETRSSGVSNINDKRSVTEQIALTPEVTSQATDAIELTANVQEAPRSSTADKQSGNSMLEEKNTTAGHQSGLYGDSRFINGSLAREQSNEMPQHQSLTNLSGESPDVGESSAFDNQNSVKQKTSYSFHKELKEYNQASSKAKSRRVGKEIKNDYDWDSLRREVEANGMKREKTANTMDSLDWEAVRCADVNKIANTIKERGMNNMLAERIKDFLNRLVREHGSIDLEWLRDVPPDQAKEYLLSIRGLGLKSVECVRLLTLHQLAFPVDTNVGRIAVRLGWVPIQPLPESLQLHLLEMYPVLESIQKYLWPRLCKLDQRTLYELHYQMITFGKVFCTKSKPNCNACPMRGECRHFASAFASSRLALPGPEEKAIVSAEENRIPDNNPPVIINQLPLSLTQATELSVGNQQSEATFGVNNCEPIIEEPATPEPQCTEISENDIEDTLCEDPDEIPTIKLNMEEFTQTLQNYMQKSMELQEGDMSKALVALTATAASIPMPKLKNVNRLRTEHLVYELPDSHPLLDGLDKREPDDPGRYLLAIWTPGETANSIQPPERRCDSQECGQLCGENTCFSCNSFRESESQVVRGTLLIPCRTAMRGSFPLNGTYFQVNEVFADHDSSLCPITVPREWIWNLPRRTVYFGTSVPSIFKGLTTEGIQHCFWRGFVCVRGFDQNLRAPRPLMARLHFPASKLQRTQGKADGNKT